ncbi:hypothetical protein BOTBODRAFT_25755 [Botryobasidium botryosum FD-172 SS1]|uniref:Uncharacterized protein n=1 Tax=Botryobasidium botryosum (strain FD-172 SS1) TaxID=930990 RepID=A0A067N329_BOTB1|nr:hypothetical protein BOTBODRAFT_25755 [Botryobasidium botryosum FD-172 SS1]
MRMIWTGIILIACVMMHGPSCNVMLEGLTADEISIIAFTAALLSSCAALRFGLVAGCKAYSKVVPRLCIYFLAPPS